ncbi:helicase-associated domain-containing protein [Corynebacterium sp. A21]|uniref:helicase-associated domain-containing protein n=1 Tax=Corynebacterium sp. A21 TaxID=3457318 RepID=UPI003FD5C94D
MKNSSSKVPSTAYFRRWLSQLDDEQLAQTLRLRPDAVLPIPPGFSPLAARLRLRASVSRSMRTLDALHLAVLEAAADLGAELHPVTAPEVVNNIQQRTGNTPRELIEEAIAGLRARALLFGEEELQLLPEAMPSLPSDWQLLPEASGAQLPATQVRELLAALEPRQRKVLDTLASSGGRGLTKDAAPDADPTRPIPQLIASGLLTRIDVQTVALPLSIRRAMRGEEHLEIPLLPSPRFSPGPPDAKAITRADQSGAAAGLEVARQLHQLIELLGAQPVALLKEGDVGLRATTRLAKDLALSEEELIRAVCLGEAAGLLGRGQPVPVPVNDEGVDYLAPTPAADPWLEADLGSRWATLLQGWWSSVWETWQEDHRLLSRESQRDQLPETRRLIIAQLTRPAIGVALTQEELLQDLRFSAPVAALRISTGLVSEILREARWIGALAGDVATSVMRSLAEQQDLTAIAAEITPGTVERVILQADMTIMAPGPLPRKLQEELDLLAELESAGLASVYRVTETSVRRALDTGRTSTDLMSFLSAHSLGEVPQSITYLIEDVARRHGSLRGGPAMSYLRCDDPTVLVQVVGTPAAELVALRLIAPTIAIAQAPLFTVIAALKEYGIHAVAEDATGASLDIRPPAARVTVKLRGPQQVPGLDETRIRAAVAAIKRAEGADASAQTGTRATADPLTVLQSAARAGRTVTLGFVDKQGTAVHRVVRPLKVGGGQVDAVDPATGSAHRFTLHRITEVILD